MIARRPFQAFGRASVAPQGFAWWYLDVVDARGNGAVLIWSWGLPFLPAAPGSALEHPSLNLAIYERGKPVFYALSAFSAGSAEGDGTTFRFGRSRITSRLGDLWTFEADLDGDLPGGRFEGRIRATGRRVFDPGDGTEGDHEWTLLATGEAHVDVVADGQRFEVGGRAYHDRNTSRRPVGDLGIAAWWWGRVALPEEDLVFYRLVGEGRVDHTLRIRDGVVEEAGGLVVSGAHTSVYGPSWPAVVHVGGIPVVLGPAVDEGPFYVRLLARVGESTGFAEVVRVDRIGLPLHRPFVQMAVHYERGANSLWLPLFAGPRRGRPGRLLRWWAA